MGHGLVGRFIVPGMTFVAREVHLIADRFDTNMATCRLATRGLAGGTALPIILAIGNTVVSNLIVSDTQVDQSYNQSAGQRKQ